MTDLSRFVRKADLAASKLRLAIQGPGGSGKTFSALALASGLADRARVVVVDTENRSADKYARQFNYDTTDPETFRQVLPGNSGNVGENDPRLFQAALETLAPHYDVVIIDSGSLAWQAAKDSIDVEKKRFGGNAWSAWSVVTPRWEAFCNAILKAPCHVIVTMRVKTEWAQEDGPKGQKTPKEVGLAPIWREDARYLFDVILDLDRDHVAVVGKSRCFELADRTFDRPGADLATLLRRWLSGAGPTTVQEYKASPEPEPAQPAPSPAPAARDERAEFFAYLAKEGGVDAEDVAAAGLASSDFARIEAVARQWPVRQRIQSTTRDGVVYQLTRRAHGQGWTCTCEAGQFTPKGEPSPCKHAQRAELVYTRALAVTRGAADRMRELVVEAAEGGLEPLAAEVAGAVAWRQEACR